MKINIINYEKEYGFFKNIQNDSDSVCVIAIFRELIVINTMHL